MPVFDVKSTITGAMKAQNTLSFTGSALTSSHKYLGPLTSLSHKYLDIKAEHLISLLKKRTWIVNWPFQSRKTLWCRQKLTDVGTVLCWPMSETSICIQQFTYFEYCLLLRPSIKKRRKQILTSGVQCWQDAICFNTNRPEGPSWLSLSWAIGLLQNFSDLQLLLPSLLHYGINWY